MPKPIFHFDDPGRGLPRHPVPVRIACLAADWSPKLFASLVSWAIEEGGSPLIDVYAFNERTQNISDVTSSSYSTNCKNFSGELSNDLLVLPANHFVWSDEFVSAFSDYIDNVIGRETAREGRYGIRWNSEAADEYVTAINECADLSSLVQDKASHVELKSTVQSNAPPNLAPIAVSDAKPERSIVPMQSRIRDNDWNLIIKECIGEFEKENLFTPTEFELWQKLHSFQNAALGGEIGFIFKASEEHLTFMSLKDLGRQAFSKRYKRLYPS